MFGRPSVGSAVPERKVSERAAAIKPARTGRRGFRLASRHPYCFVRSHSRESERLEVLQTAGHDAKIVCFRNAVDDGVRHSGMMAGGDCRGFEPSHRGRGLRVDADDLVVLCRDEAGEPELQPRRLRRRALGFEQSDPLLDLVDRDDRQEHSSLSVHPFQPVEKDWDPRAKARASKRRSCREESRSKLHVPGRRVVALEIAAREASEISHETPPLAPHRLAGDLGRFDRNQRGDRRGRPRRRRDERSR